MPLTAVIIVHRIVRHIGGALRKACPQGLMRDIRSATRDIRPLNLTGGVGSEEARACRIVGRL